jgi:predicted exporter
MVSKVFRAGVHHRRCFGLCLLSLTLLGGWLALKVPMEEGIAVMLPDSDPAFATSYALLKKAPFSRSVLIDLEAPTAGQAVLLAQSAERLRERLQAPWISQVIGGLSLEAGALLLDGLFQHMPQLFTETDAAALASKTTLEQVEETLQSNLNALSGPEGLWLKRWLTKDPLAFRNQVLRKLSAVAALPDVGFEEGALIDQSGRHTLLLVETPVSMEDSQASEQLLQYLNQVIAESVPETLTARLVCAHRYTVANANAIKRDLVLVFVFSSVGLIMVFVLLLRHWRAVFVFLIPLLAILVGVLATAAVFGTISVMTVGFGAVLMGISVDYGLHVFFALSRPQLDRAKYMSRLGVPMVVSCATTVGVFTVLLWSGMPIQRQLAIFSIAGLIGALVLALAWLPHWMVERKAGHWLVVPSTGCKKRRWIVALWLALLVACLPFSLRVNFDGDLRNVGLMPEDLLADEYCVRDTWGDPRGQALVVVESDDVQAALAVNEQVHAQLSQFWGPGELFSLAPLLPSLATQKANLERWQRFWHEDGRLDRLRETLKAKGSSLGFKDEAFVPLFAWIEEDRKPFAVSDFRKIAGSLLDLMLLSRSEGLGLISIVPDNEQTIEAFNNDELGLPPGVEAISQQWFSSSLRQLLEHDFQRFLLMASVVVVLVLAVALRRPSEMILCLLPPVTGLMVMLAVMGLLGIKVNMFNIAASVLVMGLSIDYGVFIVRRPPIGDGATEQAVATSVLTTLCGFGALALASHPAMFSLGITVVLGIIPATVCALLVIPALQGRAPGEQEQS